jgi:hypothetical protein
MAINGTSVQVGPWRSVRYDTPPEECAPDELNSMENVRIGPAGWLVSRLGTLPYQSLAAIGGTPTLTMATEFMPNASTTHTVIVAGAVIYKEATGWTDITGSVTATAGNDNTWESVNANGVLVATNGVDTNAWKWTGAGNATDLDDNARFTKGRHIEWFDNRLWIGNVNGATGQLWYSDTAAIETWGGTSFFNFGGIITGLKATQNQLVVHTTIGIFTLTPTGNATVPYHPQPQTSRAGIDGRSCVSLPDDTQLMLLKDGIYKWRGGATLERVSHALDGEGYWDDINPARLHKAFALEWPLGDEVWFMVPNGTSQTNMNHIIVYSKRRKVIIPNPGGEPTVSGAWHGPYTGFERNCASLIAGAPHLGGFDGFLWDHNVGDDDNGAAITSEFETAHPSPMGADVRVRWLNARHFYDGKGDYDLAISQRGTALNGTTKNITLRGEGFTLDVDKLDEDNLSDVVQLSQDSPLQDYAPNSGLKASMSTADQSFKYYKAQLRYKPVGRFLKPPPE